MKNRWLLAVFFSLPLAAHAQTISIERASVSSTELEQDGSSYATAPPSSAISKDGRYVVFASTSTNLAPEDATSQQDVFLRDTLLGTTELISIASRGGVAAEGFSEPGNVSGDGRYVTFSSVASDLDSTDANDEQDVFLRDRTLGTTKVISKTSTGLQGDEASTNGIISSDGNVVVFSSRASNMSSLPNPNFYNQLYRKDLSTGVVTPITKSADGLSMADTDVRGIASVSSDGRFIAFESDASNLIIGKTGFISDIYVFDAATAIVERVNLSEVDGAPADAFSSSPSISADGRFVVYESYATNLVNSAVGGNGDVYLYDRKTDTTTLLSKTPDGKAGDARSKTPSISGDGRFVAFSSLASNFYTDDTTSSPDLFLWDSVTDSLILVARTSGADGTEIGNGESFPAISRDGKAISFVSFASDLVGSDLNSREDIFVARVTLPETTGTVTPGLEIEDPPSVFVQEDKSVLIQMKKFLRAKGKKKKKGSAIAEAKAKAAGFTFRYQLTVTGPTQTSNNTVRRIISKSNEKIVKKLPPGNYNTSYRVVLYQKGTDTVAGQTKRSPKTGFTIP